MGSKHTQTPLFEADPWLLLALGILQRARADAARGDLSAIAFLLTDGTTIADKISDGASEAILRFCKDVVSNVDAGKLKVRWHIEEPY